MPLLAEDAEPDRAPHALEGVRPRRPAGRLRGRLAGVARELDRRRDPAPVSAPAARIAAAALRNPRLDVEETVAERERMRDALGAAGFDCPPSAGELRRSSRGADRADELEAQGLVVRRFPATRSGSPSGCRPRTTGSSPRSAPRPRRPPPARRSSSARPPRPALRASLDLDGGAARGSTPGSASSTTCSRSSPSTAGSTSS